MKTYSDSIPVEDIDDVIAHDMVRIQSTPDHVLVQRVMHGRPIAHLMMRPDCAAKVAGALISELILGGHATADEVLAYAIHHAGDEAPKLKQ